jgi:hypothetical protein
VPGSHRALETDWTDFPDLPDRSVISWPRRRLPVFLSCGFQQQERSAHCGEEASFARRDPEDPSDQSNPFRALDGSLTRSSPLDLESRNGLHEKRKTGTALDRLWEAHGSLDDVFSHARTPPEAPTTLRATPPEMKWTERVGDGSSGDAPVRCS